MICAAREEDLQRVAHFAQSVRYGLIGLSLAAYGFAYYLWTAGQSLEGLIIVLFGYMVLRSRVNLCFGLTVRYYRREHEIQALLAALDADTLAQGVDAMRTRLQDGSRESADNE